MTNGDIDHDSQAFFHQERRILKKLSDPVKVSLPRFPQLLRSSNNKKYNLVHKTENMDQFSWATTLFLVLEEIEGSQSLDNWMRILPTIVDEKSNDWEIDENWAIVLFVARLLDDISNALATMDKFDFTHGDVKPENILMRQSTDKRKHWEFYLIDFGLSFSHDPRQINEYLSGGTLKYMGPENYRIYEGMIDLDLLKHHDCVDTYALVRLMFD